MTDTDAACATIEAAVAEIVRLRAELADLRRPVGDEELVRSACRAADIHLTCSWPDCSCTHIPRAVTAIAPRIRAAERERCAALAGNVSLALSAGAPMCPCGNGRTPVTAYRYACEAFAAAIRRENGDG